MMSSFIRSHFTTALVLKFRSRYSNKYVRIIGTVRVFGNKRHLNATIIRIIDDFMEAVFHFNEVMAVTMFNRHGAVSLSIFSPLYSLTKLSFFPRRVVVVLGLLVTPPLQGARMQIIIPRPHQILMQKTIQTSILSN